jgi:hypothetical protein
VEQEEPGTRAAYRLARKPEVLVFAGYALVTALMTFPAVTLLTRTYAERRDPLGGLWWFWWLRYSFYHHLAVNPMPLAAVPFGVSISPYRTDPLNGLLVRALTVVVNETVAYNILLLLSYLTAAIACYFLVRYLTGSRSAAAVSGLIFAFCPYMLVQGKEHLSLVLTLWIPVFVLLLIKAWRRRTAASIAACGLSFVVLALFNFQYGLFSGIFAVTFLLVTWVAGRPWRRLRQSSSNFAPVVAVVAAVVILSATVVLLLARGVFGTRNFMSSLYLYSARPWDYFIPHAEGVLFGGITTRFVTAHLHGGFLVENSLFLGYVPLLLAAVGAVGVLARGRRGGGAVEAGAGTGALNGPPAGGALAEGGGEAGSPAERPVEGSPGQSETRRFVWGFVIAGAVAFLFSMPPTASVLGVKLYFPSYFLFKILPQFRAYARFGMIVVMCVAVLAGYGIALLEKANVFGKLKVAAVALLMGLILLEFTIVPPFYSLDTSATTDYYRWLKSRPGQPAAAIYPMFVQGDFKNYEYFFQQRIHQKKLVNGAGENTDAETYRQSILGLYEPQTPSLLKTLGTKYVMIIPSLFLVPATPHMNYPFPVKIDYSRLPAGLVEVKKFPDCRVYEVTAPPAVFIPLFGSGVYQAYVDPDGATWHPATREAVIGIESKLKRPAACDIKLRVMSARSQSAVTFLLNGRQVAAVEAPVWPVDVAIRRVTLNPGQNVLVVRSNGRIVSLTEVPGYSDVAAAMMLSGIQVERQP